MSQSPYQSKLKYHRLSFFSTCRHFHLDCSTESSSSSDSLFQLLQKSKNNDNADKMKLFILLIASVIFASTSCQIMLSLEDYEKFIQHNCYNKTRNNRLQPSGQEIPLANSLGNFLSIVERLELNNTDWSAEDTAKMLLKRFVIDGLIQKGSNLKQEDFSQGKTMIINEFFKGVTLRNEKFPEEHLTENEKCSLYYMLSYTVNDTVREGIDKPNITYRSYAQKRSSQVQASSLQQAVVATKPREQGVVSIGDKEDHAISLGKVLVGIAASGLTVGKIFPEKENLPDFSWNPVLALTLAETLALAQLKKDETDPNNIKDIPNGKWNSTVCTTEYQLDEQVHWASYSLLRGAVDGLIIGSLLKDRSDLRSGLKLSQLIRAYYSYTGLPSSNEYNFCERGDVLQSLTINLEEETENYALMFSKLQRIVTDKSKISEKISKSISSFNYKINDIVESGNDIECQKANFVTQKLPICETPHDVFVIMDTRTTGESLKSQQKIISLLANNMDMRQYGDSMSVFAYGTQNEELYSIAYNTTSQGCATCYPSWIHPSNSFPRDDEVELFKGLNKTIAKFEFEKRLAPGVPGKVVVYFNSQGINSDNTRLMDELGIFKGNHRDVPIIAFGDKEELEVIVWNREKDIFDLPVNEFHPSVIEPMWERLCSVPATLQYDKCWELTNSRETLNKYIGYVTPNHIQYWAMYPEYFIKSRSIRFTFKSSRGATDQVKVCFSRGTRTPETEEQNCKETSKNDKEISFWMSNPCEGYSVWNCPPFYFSIQGIRNEEQTTQFSISCAELSEHFRCQMFCSKNSRPDRIHCGTRWC
ncbi:uncharacterized protein LOC143232432 isoform X2 [Tachypleus tridentatus]|uniref:uncharacterized protein LOC143232432 isoform X2 n=1 Tax=Tachypleus tridentatus TaxID=6853 RepID=UPI003FD60685